MIISFFPCPMLFSTLATNLCDKGRTIWTTLQNVLSFLTVNLDLFSITLPTMCVEVCKLMQVRGLWTFISFIHIIKDRKNIYTDCHFVAEIMVYNIYILYTYFQYIPSCLFISEIQLERQYFTGRSFFDNKAFSQIELPARLYTVEPDKQGAHWADICSSDNHRKALSLDNRQVETSESQGGGGRWKPLM